MLDRRDAASIFDDTIGLWRCRLCGTPWVTGHERIDARHQEVLTPEILAIPAYDARRDPRLGRERLISHEETWPTIEEATRQGHAAAARFCQSLVADGWTSFTAPDAPDDYTGALITTENCLVLILARAEDVLLQISTQARGDA